MRVLITGGTGFIGGVVARRLLARGDTVVILARSPNGRAAGSLAALGARVVSGDIRDQAAVSRAVEGCDVVVHAAGLPRPTTWRTFRAVHIEGTRNVVSTAHSAGVKRVVNIASQAVLFSGRDLLDIDEACPYPDRFIDPYSATKAEAERLALTASRAGSLEVTSLRPCVVWGRGDTTVLPIMAKLARSSIGIPMCGDGRNIEATTHIGNLADATLLALEAPAAPGRAYFITDPFLIQWREFMARQLEAAGIKPKFTRVPRAFAISSAWALDRCAAALRLPVPLAYFGVRSAMTSRRFRGERARTELGYAPRVDLEAGLAGLRDWVTEIGGPAALMRAAHTARPVPNAAAAQP